jgi:hypothetical protein
MVYGAERPMARSVEATPSCRAGRSTYALVHYCQPGYTITVRVYDVMGYQVGDPVITTSDGQTWDRITVPAPSSAGTYFLHVSVNGQYTTLNYSVN